MVRNTGELQRFFIKDGEHWRPQRNIYQQRANKKYQKFSQKLGKVGTLSEEMEIEYPIWRIWSKGRDSFKEIAENWTLSEVIKANALLDMEEAMDGYVPRALLGLKVSF